MRNLLIDYFAEFHPLSTRQWGFTHGKSTTGAWQHYGTMECSNTSSIRMARNKIAATLKVHPKSLVYVSQRHLYISCVIL